MKRLAPLLAILVLAVLIAAWWQFFLSPRRAEVADLEDQILSVENQQQQTRVAIGQLRSIRERAPELEAEALLSETRIPVGAALPTLLSDIQSAANDADVVVRSISIGRPSTTETTDESGIDLYAVQVTISVEGNYFQLVDVLRRLEDPALVARGVLTDSLTLGSAAYPQLQASVNLRVFTVLDDTPPPSPEGEDGTEPGVEGAEGTEGADEGFDDTAGIEDEG